MCSRTLKSCIINIGQFLRESRGDRMKLLRKMKKNTVFIMVLTFVSAMQWEMVVSAAGKWTPAEDILHAVKDQPYSMTVSYEGAVSYVCEESELPKGISFDPDTGILSGTPEEVGDSSITVSALGGNDDVMGIKEYAFRVTEAASYSFSSKVNDPSMGQIGMEDSIWPEGTELEVEVTANAGYVIDSVMLNDIKAEDIRSGSSSYTMHINMDKDQAVYAVFAAATQIEEKEPEKTVSGNEVIVEIKEEEIIEDKPVIDPSQMQTVNYKTEILTDWQRILQALKILTPEMLTNPDEAGKTLVLQIQNVKSIPAEIKDSIATTDGSGYTKVLQCNLGYGVSMVFNGAADNSGFNGISNANVVAGSEKRGKKSVAVSVMFDSHESLGTVASLQINLPQCSKGTKVSVYAETKTVDSEGNVSVGENVCIGTTKADAEGNVEVPIQSTANYMFVYKAAKE